MINDRYMNLLEDKYKESYLYFMQGKKLVPFSSHQPILIHLLNTIKEGKVLEYGMGWNSTPIIHMICGMQNRKVLSVETDINWINKFSDYKSENHQLLHIEEKELCKWNHRLFHDDYAIAFIDGAPGEARTKIVQLLKDYVNYFVIHDTEEWVGNFKYPGFSYQWDFSGFKHQYHLQKGGPDTSLISNLDEINKDVLTVFE